MSEPPDGDPQSPYSPPDQTPPPMGYPAPPQQGPPAPYGQQPPSGQAPYGQQPPYGYYPPASYPPSQGTNGLAIAAMVLGILWLYWVGSILALIFGYIARNQIKASGEGGNGMAIAGIVLGWIGIATLVFVVFAVAVVNN